MLEVRPRAGRVAPGREVLKDLLVLRPSELAVRKELPLLRPSKLAVHNKPLVIRLKDQPALRLNELAVRKDQLLLRLRELAVRNELPTRPVQDQAMCTPQQIIIMEVHTEVTMEVTFRA